MHREESPLLRTKLYRPAPATDAVLRPRLLEALAAGEEASLTLISAPAGFGKSTIVSQWIEGRRENAGWLSLDESDNDPPTFLRYLIHAIRTGEPSACEKTLEAIGRETVPPLSTLIPLLLNELLELEKRITVVLDDFHRLREGGVLRLLTALLERPLPSLHLVIVSRRDPQLPLGALRASGRLQELRMNALRFTTDEGIAFLGQAAPTKVTLDLRAPAETTEGWPVALRLLLLRLREVPDPEAVIERLPSIANEVREYLVTEVLENLPPDRLTMLLRLAVVDRFSAPLCAVLSDHDGFDGREFLHWLSGSGLFAIPLDPAGHWFRFHHYFQEVLARRLERGLAEKARGDLHSRASLWFEEEGLLEEAFAHGLRTPDCRRAAELIALPRVLRPAHDYRLISNWLKRLPEGVAERRPGTLIELAWQAVRDGRIAEVETLVDRLDKLLDQAGWDPREESSARASAHALHLEVLFSNGRLHDLIRRAEKALTEIDEGEQTSRQSIIMAYAIALTRTGEPARGRQALQQAIAELGDPNQAALLYSTECQIEALSLNVPGLKRAADRYVSYQEEQNNVSDQPWTRYLAALARYQANDLEEAREILSGVTPESGGGYEAAYFRHTSLAASVLFAAGRHQEAIDAAQALHFQMLERSASREAIIAEAIGIEFLLRSGEIAGCASWFESFDDSNPVIPFLYPGRYLIYARTGIALNTPETRERARKVLAQLLAQAGATPAAADVVEVCVLRALLHEAEGGNAEAEKDLGRAVALAAPGGALRVVADYGARLAPILQRLELDEQELAFVGKIMAILGVDDEGPQQPLLEALSKREFEILELLADRHSNKGIAERLFISVDTVKRHTANIYGKLGVHRRADAVAKASGLGLLKDRPAGR